MSGTSDFLYDSARQAFATAQINWPAAAVNAALVSQFYSPQLSHVNLSEIDPTAIIARDLVCTNVTSVKGVCAATIPELDSVVSVFTVAAVILYIKGVDDAHSPLVYYSSTGPGFPFAIQGFDYTVGYDQTAGGFFQV